LTQIFPPCSSWVGRFKSWACNRPGSAYA
jgi:hypothetical protein